MNHEFLFLTTKLTFVFQKVFIKFFKLHLEFPIYFDCVPKFHQISFDRVDQEILSVQVEVLIIWLDFHSQIASKKVLLYVLRLRLEFWLNLRFRAQNRWFPHQILIFKFLTEFSSIKFHFSALILHFQFKNQVFGVFKGFIQFINEFIPIFAKFESGFLLVELASLN